MESENDPVQMLAEALVSHPKFNGAVLSYGEKVGDKFAWCRRQDKLDNRDFVRLLDSFIQRSTAPESASTDDLIKELRDRPGFDGVIVQELGAEAAPLLGRSTVQWDCSRSMPPVRAAQLLRQAADRLLESEGNS